MEPNLLLDSRLSLEDNFPAMVKYSIFEKLYGRSVDDFVKNGTPITNSVFNSTSTVHVPLYRPVKAGFKVSSAYIIRHNKTGKICPGSSGDINTRTGNNENKLRNGKHRIKQFQEAYNDDPNVQFYFILVNRRDEAYDIERWLLDRYRDSGLLFNVAIDVKGTKGLKHTEQSVEKMRKAHTGKKIPPEVLARRSLTRSIAISINDTMYGSMKDASLELRIPDPTIHYRVNSTKAKWGKWFYL